ncbi:ANTAR domain-containing protein [Streptomyces kunmingensis]|uniref:ANTAR domain-containing protein n=1 Tax=Streptomyces kunmingensis TaxID=68225 RepID=A0ABU6CED5_9ACTN|nr:GAF and ANTAR domain-containing protein [Streptomyces kunmingensis]MEB3962745.1 ANTAR domain-containing protein [Streptomyces kunmingensis]
MSREQHIVRTFLELADTLVEDFDIIDFLHQMTVRCQELLDVTDAAVFLAHPGPHLHSPAPCDPGPGLQRVLDTACLQGPALEAHRTHRSVTALDEAETAARWPEFAQHRQAAGYTLATALPMRLRRNNIGSLLLLRTGHKPLGADDLSLAQALADAATIGLLQARTIRQQHTVHEQLHTALQSRILIEQAKGVLAARQNITLNEAFDAIRQHARHHRLLLSDVARDVIDNRLTPAPAAAQPHTTEADAE